MIPDWPKIKISEVCDLIVDCVNKTAPHIDFETPYKMIRTPNIKDGVVNRDNCRFVTRETYEKWTRRARVNKGDVLLTREAPMGEVGLVNFQDTVFLGQRIMQYRANPEKLHSDYLLYAFLSPFLQSQFRRYDSSGSIVSHITVPDCFDFELPMPSLVIQKSITKVLRNIDDKIELNNKINSELEAVTKLIYEYWFVQFDFPDENGKPYKSSGGKMVYDENLKKEIPYAWSVRNISEKMKISSGYPFKSSNYDDSGTYKIVTIKNVQDNRLSLNNTDLVNSIPSDINSKCILKLKDILISLTGNVGRMCLVDEQNLLLNQRVGKFQTDQILKNYFFLTYRRPEFRLWLERISTGTSQKNLSPIDATNRLHAFPDSSILVQFDQLVNPMINKIISNLQENKKLESLRNWLLPLLMNGQITLSE